MDGQIKDNLFEVICDKPHVALRALCKAIELERKLSAWCAIEPRLKNTMSLKDVLLTASEFRSYYLEAITNSCIHKLSLTEISDLI